MKRFNIFTVSAAKCHNENEAPPCFPHEKLDHSKSRLSPNSLARGIILSVKPLKDKSLPDAGNFSSIVTKVNENKTKHAQQERSRIEMIGKEDNVEGGMSDDLPSTKATKGF